MHKRKELAFALAFLLLVVFLLSVIGRALRPVRVDYGAVWGPYLAEPRNSLDYIYLGSSYAYCDVDPVTVYGDSGLTGYVLAGPEQTLSITYHYLRQALRTQRPSAVLLEASALHFDPYQAYTQVNVGYMPAGLYKLQAIQKASEESLRTGLLFDLYFYHSRWKDVTLSEVRAALKPPKTDLLKGFTGVDGAFKDILNGPFQREEKTDEIYQANFSWLELIADLCQEEGIPLAVVFHPTYSRLSQAGYARIRADLEAIEVPLYDWSAMTGEAGLEPEAHFYDPGHLNQAGARQFSAWLAEFLTEELKLAPREQEPENSTAWDTAWQSRQVLPS